LYCIVYPRVGSKGIYPDNITERYEIQYHKIYFIF